MTTLSVEQVAERAGVSEAFVCELAESGVLEVPADDLDEGSVRRVMLISACTDAGMPLEAIASAVRSGHVTLQALDRGYYARWGQRMDVTWGELAAQSGVDLGFVRQMYEAIGYARPDEDTRPRVDERAMMQAVAIPYLAGVDHDAVLRLMRVYGESFRRLTRTETELWHEWVDVPAERAGASQRDILTGGEEFGEAIMATLDASTLAIYHRMQEHAWMDDLVEHIELGLVEAGVYSKPDRPSTMAFMDLSGYTALTEERGDEAAARLATSLAAIVQRTASIHAGEALKFLGDGVMFRFRDTATGVRGALEVVHSTIPAGLPPAHVGMHVGAVIRRDGDVFGRTVNLASRISGRAGPGEVLVTQEIVEAVPGDAGVRFEEIGPVELKGVAAPVPLFRADA